jgi:spore coat polysaccharide biosynthesis protein SpsF
MSTVNLAILQARTTSTRLPGKVLKPLLGVPMILRQLERVRRSERLDDIVLATSVDPSDDQLAQAVMDEGYQVRRGPLDDVLARFLAIVDELRPEVVVRLTGDNPLVDPGVIDTVLGAHLAWGSDYTSNSQERTYPYGLDVECVRAAALQELEKFSLTPAEREHVTLGVYSRPTSFSVSSVTQASDQSELRWSVDYPEDFNFVEAVYSELYEQKPTFDKSDILALLDSRPDLRRTVHDVPA